MPLQWPPWIIDFAVAVDAQHTHCHSFCVSESSGRVIGRECIMQGWIAPGPGWTSCEGVRNKWRVGCREKAESMWGDESKPGLDGLFSEASDIPTGYHFFRCLNTQLSYTLTFFFPPLFSFNLSAPLTLSAAFTESRDTLCCRATCKSLHLFHSLWLGCASRAEAV